MIQKLITILLVGCLFVTGHAFADPRNKGSREAGYSSGNQLVQDKKPLRVSNQRAAELVKRRYSGSRVLGVSLIDSKGPPVYRVKTLSDKGVVRSVFVDGTSGEVFE